MEASVDMYAPKAGRINNYPLYPPCMAFPDDIPWTTALQNKTVLIVHPFKDSILQNIPKLDKIWANAHGPAHSCFPITAHNTKIVRAPLPVKTPTISWLDALEKLQQEIREIGHFDIALLGCGGFGMPLVAFIKSLPHKPSAMYVGGSLQLFFGIHGNRWSHPSSEYFKMWSEFYNNEWTWPLDSDVASSNVGNIEGSSYVKPGQAI